jgi:hypothetical protein
VRFEIVIDLSDAHRLAQQVTLTEHIAERLDVAELLRGLNAFNGKRGSV